MNEDLKEVNVQPLIAFRSKRKRAVEDAVIAASKASTRGRLNVLDVFVNEPASQSWRAKKLVRFVGVDNQSAWIQDMLSQNNKRVLQQQVPLPLPCVNFAQITRGAMS